MWLRLDLDGIDFHFQINDYQKSSRDEWYAQWCKVDITLHSPKWLDHRISSEILLSREVEDIKDSVEALLQDRLAEQTALGFVEPDISFVLRPKRDLRATGKYAYLAPGHEMVDIDAYLQIHFWNEGLTMNYLSLHFNRADLEKLLIYLRLVTGQITRQSAEVQGLLEQGFLG